MTVGEGSRHALLGAFFGLLAAGVAHSIFTLVGLTQIWTWYVKFALVLVGASLWLTFKIVQERVLAKDYQKMIAERKRRMR